MEIECEQLNPHACKTYLLTKPGSGDAALIDPVIDHVNDYIHLLEKRDLTLTRVVDTHTHADHISGSATLKDMTGCEYVMHVKAVSRCSGRRVKDGAQVELCRGVKAKIMHTPGHTPDSISLIVGKRLFTGDALFLDDGGAGRDDLPGGDPAAHWETLQKLSALQSDLVVHPAHDYRNRAPSSLGQQKASNPHLKPRTRDEFVQYVEDLKLGPADWMKEVLKANYACARDPGAAWIPADSPACELKGTMAAGANDIDVPRVQASELKTRLRAGKRPLLLDVREADELVGPLGHIDDIVHIPVPSLSSRLNELEQYRDSAIVTICRSGGRAHTAAQILTAAGFTDVEVLDGGMIAWNSL